MLCCVLPFIGCCQVRERLAAAMEEAGIRPPSTEARWGQALTALKGVWASKFNERAYISMRKVGLRPLLLSFGSYCRLRLHAQSGGLAALNLLLLHAQARIPRS